jgi:hypothetical protein
MLDPEVIQAAQAKNDAECEADAHASASVAVYYYVMGLIVVITAIIAVGAK